MAKVKAGLTLATVVILLHIQCLHQHIVMTTEVSHNKMEREKACGNYTPNFLHYSILSFSEDLIIMLSFMLLILSALFLIYLQLKSSIKVRFLYK